MGKFDTKMNQLVNNTCLERNFATIGVNMFKMSPCILRVIMIRGRQLLIVWYETFNISF